MQKGDLVKHDAGTIKMLVLSVASTGVLCEWVDLEGHPRKGMFDTDAFEPRMDQPVTPAPEEPPALGVIGELKKTN